MSLKDYSKNNITKASVSGLSYENILDDVYNAVKDSDEFKNSFNVFTSSEASRMMAEMFAYIGSQLASRMDQIGNELYIDTASKSGLTRLLKLVGYKMALPSAAHLKCRVTAPGSRGETLVISSGINPGGESAGTLNPIGNTFYSISPKTNSNTHFEFIRFDELAQKYDYTTPITFATPEDEMILHEGVTKYQNYMVRSLNKDIITLPSYPVIDKSVRIYYSEKTASGSGNNAIYSVNEMKEVDNFFSTEALTCNTGYYTVRNRGNGICEIVVQPHEGDVGKELVIMYRVGGGSIGNISVGAINGSQEWLLNNSTTRGSVSFFNVEAGNGGKDEVDLDKERDIVSQDVRCSKILSDEDSYEYLFKNVADSDIGYIKAYGENNIETKRLSNAYGYYFNPVSVWLLILKTNTLFEELYSDEMSGNQSITEFLNDICFEILDINPRFNETYQVKKALINQKISASELESLYGKDTMRYSIPISSKSLPIIKEETGCSISITESQYVDSSNPEKKGVGYFSLGAQDIENYKSWNDIIEATEVEKGTIYICSDEDVDGEIGYRFKAKKNISAPDADWHNDWEKLDYAFIFDNLLTDGAEGDDILNQYISVSNSEGTELYSPLSHSFEMNIDEWNRIKDGSGKVNISGNITIGNTTVELSGNYSMQDLVDAINTQLNPSTHMVLLKDDIQAESLEYAQDMEVDSSTSYVYSSQLSFQLSGDNVAIETPTTYGELVSNINDALGIFDGKYACVLFGDDECYKVAIISATQFTFTEKNFSSNQGIYTHFLNHSGTTSYSTNSILFDIPSSEIAEWEDYKTSSSSFARIDEKTGTIVFGFLGDSVTISTNDNLLQTLFGIGDEPETANSKRTINLVVSEDGKSARLEIKMANSADKLLNDIYINVFGGEQDSFILGSFYEKENIENNLPDIDERLRTLLTRKPIKYLYSTKFIQDGTGEFSEDIYNSDYQIKFSSKRIQKQTFEQISKGDYPAKVTLDYSSEDFMQAFEVGTYLYVKVDSMDYSEDDREIEDIPVTIKNGYAMFPLWTIGGKKASYFVSQVASLFQNIYEGTELVNYLDTFFEEDGTCGIRTVSADCFSSIDFGDTPEDVLSSLFTTKEKVHVSEEGQIDLVPIKYKTLNISGTFTDKKTIVSVGSQAPVTIENTGSFVVFRNAVENIPNLKYDNGRIVLNTLDDGISLIVKVKYETEDELAEIENFYINEEYTTTTESGENFCVFTKTNAGGDYSITSKYENGERRYELKLTDDGINKLPYGDIYFHMSEDYTNDHIVDSVNGENVYTDEYIWNHMLLDRKMMMVEHIYKQPRFVQFDVKLTCYISNNAGLNKKEEYRSKIENLLKMEFSPYSSELGKPVSQTDIKLMIPENIPNINRVEISYLGFDMETEEGNSDELTVDFNQKLVLATRQGDIVAGNTSYEAVHGANITVKYGD